MIPFPIAGSGYWQEGNSFVSFFKIIYIYLFEREQVRRREEEQRGKERDKKIPR